ncbi:alpha-tubulin N-acetyltransferase isoform X2 [Octopus bimaculoides]|uniref:alpha-tubulin N-acetyltransferase isoform X2 n=1 Tax=Octopus bimaculoides TaxID=37653 RepID=UPI0022E28CA4|nr:alpha-tubulin N-acetyltransferase isoform X2 [Octopus bimaculoides]
MEFDFNINHIFTNRVTKFDKRVKQFHTNRRELTQQKDPACIVIDKLGIASSKAQGLRTPVTSTSKLKDSDHLIYLLKDEQNRNLGAAIGFLKIGYKSLFVYDHNGIIHELTPMCILDFYIHESRQRQGFGKELFDYMLQDTRLQPCQLAIDKPSFKFSSFLKKHYNLIHSIPQTNNFVIYRGFFSEKKKDNHEQILPNKNAEPNIPINRLSLHEKETVFAKGQPFSKASAQNTLSLTKQQDYPEDKDLLSVTNLKPIPSEAKNSLKESHYSPIADTIRTRTPQTTVKLHRTTPLPLGDDHNRHLSSAHGTLPEEAGNKINRTSGPQRANIAGGTDHPNFNPLMVTKVDPLSLYTNRYSYSRQHAKLLPYMDSSKIRLPQIEQDSSQCFQRKSSFPNKEINSNVPWSLFNNVAKYHSLIKRGYSHTRIW